MQIFLFPELIVPEWWGRLGTELSCEGSESISLHCCEGSIAVTFHPLFQATIMSSTIIFNVAVWKWNAEARCPIQGSDVGDAVPNCYVCIRNGFITKVSDSGDVIPSLEDFDTAVDGNGRLLLPGLMGKILQAAPCV